MIEIAYFCGAFLGFVVELAVEIVIGILFTGGTLTLGTVLEKLGETFKALSNLLIGVLKLPSTIASKTLLVFMGGLDFLFEFLAKGTDEILRVIDEVFAKLKTIEEIILVDKIDDLLLPLIKILKQNSSFVKCINLVKQNRVFGRFMVVELEATIKLYTGQAYIILNKALRGVDGVKLNKELKAIQDQQ